MRRSDRWKEGPRVEMLPLIDVMFLLLVTFVYSMTTMIRSTAIPVNLPTLDSASQEDLSSVLVLSIQGDGQWFAGGVEVDGAGLVERVQTMRAADPELVVLVNADAEARHGDVAFALDKLRSCGQERVYLAGVEGHAHATH